MRHPGPAVRAVLPRDLRPGGGDGAYVYIYIYICIYIYIYNYIYKFVGAKSAENVEFREQLCDMFPA